MSQRFNQNQGNERAFFHLPSHTLPKFLENLAPTDKKILIQVTGEITYDIREKIQSAFLYNDFEKLNIQLDLSKAAWDSLYCIQNWLVRSIILPDSVTDIDGSMIVSPTIEEILVAETNPKFVTVDGVLYNKDKSVLIRCPQAKAGNFIIPDSVIEIRISAFSGCRNLSEIKIPDSVKIIAESAFKNCSKLSELCLLESITEIGQSAFENCDSLIEVKVPDSVTTMGSRVFAECKNLKAVELSENITEIPAATFVNCQMLEYVKIPAGVKSIGLNAFRNCSSLKQIELPENVDFQVAAICENTKIINYIKSELEIPGQYNTAKVFSDSVDSDAYAQILQMMNQPWASGLSVRIMPDVHAGRGCTVGTTMSIKDKAVPSLVGADIGCGVDVLVVRKSFLQIPLQIFLEQFDELIHKQIASGREGRTKLHPFANSFDVKNFIAPVDASDSKRFLGTLGGGNHFIEIDLDDEENFYFVIHSGSRHLGKAVCDYHQKIAETCTAYGVLQGNQLTDYLHDMELAQNYAALNRSAMLDEIKNGFGIKKQDIIEEFSSIHNYIDLKNKILRKGAISAQKYEKVIIPMNMRDGCLICIGKGNPDWNYSAPHGAGRLYKRGEAKELFSLEEYQKQMQGIFSSSIASSTIDESPMAYKPMESILEKISPTAKVEKIIKPIYNFKAGGQ